MKPVPLFCLVLLVSFWVYGRAMGPRPADAQLDFGRAQLCILGSSGPARFTALVAATEAQRAQGLMDRESLPPDEVMLFKYPEPQPPETGFWMYRTKIPLEVAFLGPAGRIRAIRQMQPCVARVPRGCYVYQAGVDYVAAIEANQGFFQRHGIGLGDRVVSGDSPACPPQ